MNYIKFFFWFYQVIYRMFIIFSIKKAVNYTDWILRIKPTLYLRINSVCCDGLTTFYVTHIVFANILFRTFTSMFMRNNGLNFYFM